MAEIHILVNGESAQSPALLSPVKKSFASEYRSMLKPRHSNRSFDSDSRSMLSASASDLGRKDSKASLRSVFSRNNKAPKGTTAGGNPIFTSPFSSSSRLSQTTLPSLGPRNDSQSTLATSMERKGSDISARTTGGLSSFSRRSRFSMQPRAMKSFENSSSTRTATANRFAKPSPSSEFPILSQAYADAIKYAQLSASSLPADTIIRINNRTKAAAAATSKANTTILKKSEATNIKRRSFIEPVPSLHTEWTRKIFVLVAAGYLFQYAADGPVDRLPEKVLQLGKRSVAFASDAIPGKHWVLQISQAMDDGTMAVDSRSLLSRLSFRNSEYRRLTSNMLLVFESAEEMESWLTVFRQIIEALGGKKHAAETAPPDIEEPEEHIDTTSEVRPSTSSIVPDDPPQCPDPISPTSHALLESWNSITEEELDRAQKVAVDLSQKPTTRIRQSTDTMLSHDAPSYGSGDDARLSYVTANTSLGSRPNTPTQESEEPETQKRAESRDDLQSETQKPKEYKLSAQATPKIVLDQYSEAESATESRPTSASEPLKVKAVTSQLESAPDLSSTTVRHAMPGRKPPPVLALARPLSPVQDEPSPMKQEDLQFQSRQSHEDSPKKSSKAKELPQRPRTSSGSNRSHRSVLSNSESGRRTPDTPRSSIALKQQPSLHELRNEILAEDVDLRSSRQIVLPPNFLPPLSPRSSADFPVPSMIGTPPTTAPPDMPLPSPPMSSCSRRTSKIQSSIPPSSPSRTFTPIPPRPSSRQSLNRASMTPSPTLSHRKTTMDPKTNGNGRARRLSLQNPATVMGPPPAPPPNKDLPELPRCASPAMKKRSATPDLSSATPELRSATPDISRLPSPMKSTFSAEKTTASPMKEKRIKQLTIDTAAYKGKGPPSPMERRKLKNLKAST